MKTSLVHCELEGRLTPSWHRPLSHPKPHTLGCVFRASKRHEHARSHDGLDGLAHKEISPAAREIFKEVRPSKATMLCPIPITHPPFVILQAQENILALNGSRIRALQELKAANQKIAELEKKLEEAAKQLSSLAGHRPVDGVDQQQQPSSSTSISSPIAAEGLPPPHVQQPPPVETITVCYVTGWEDVFLHYQIDDQRKSVFSS